LKRRFVLVFGGGCVLACAILVSARALQDTIRQHPYVSLASQMETRLQFVTDFSFPQGPALQVKVYDWIVGPRQEIPNFPLEGFATFELKAGELDTTIAGATTRRHEGDHWVVPEGARLDLRVPSDTGRGDNLVSLRAVVAIRK